MYVCNQKCISVVCVRGFKWQSRDCAAQRKQLLRFYTTVAGCVLEFYFLVTSKVISTWLMICGSAPTWQLNTDAPLQNETTHWYHDLISHSVTLSWHWANQSLSHPVNTERQVTVRQVSILKVIVWTKSGNELRISCLGGLISSDSVTVPSQGPRMIGQCSRE